MITSNQINKTSFTEYEQGDFSALPVKVQFRHMKESKKVIWLVNQMMEKFAKFPIPGASATVVVDETHHREKKGVYQIKMKFSVPGERLYVARSFEKTGMNDGVYSAIAEVFENIERQLVKRHDKRAKRRALKTYEFAA